MNMRIKAALLCMVFVLLPVAALARSPCATLTIPGQQITVELLEGADQSHVDDPQSAALFRGGAFSWVIADHNTQSFKRLPLVEIGDTATITSAEGQSICLMCVAKFHGRNTGEEITDERGRNVMADYDYMMYTCRAGWRRVWVLGWEVENVEQ